MSEASLEASERISKRFFEKVLDLVKELESEEDAQGLDILPSVILTTGIMTMCRSMAADNVSALLEALRIKVERGDFTSGRVEEAIKPEKN